MMTSGGSEADLSDAVSVKKQTNKQTKQKTMSIVRMIYDNVVTKQSKFSHSSYEQIVAFVEKTCLLTTLRMDELNNSYERYFTSNGFNIWRQKTLRQFCNKV